MTDADYNTMIPLRKKGRLDAEQTRQVMEVYKRHFGTIIGDGRPGGCGECFKKMYWALQPVLDQYHAHKLANPTPIEPKKDDTITLNTITNEQKDN